MKLVKGKSLLDKIENIISTSHQVREDHLYLTVKDLYTLENPGKVDFGGSEYKAGKIVAVMPEQSPKKEKKKKEETKKTNYPWWKCSAGQYLVEINEKINPCAGMFAFFTPAPMLLRNNAFHPQVFYPLTEESLDNYRYIPLTVGEPGLNLKKNARITCLYIYHFREDFFPPS